MEGQSFMRSHSSLFVSVTQLKPWRSPSVGWDSWMCQCFPTPDPDIHPALDEPAECASVSSHLTLTFTQRWMRAKCASVSPHLTLTFTQCWMRQQNVPPFPHTWPWHSPSAGWGSRMCHHFPHLTLTFTQCWMRAECASVSPHLTLTFTQCWMRQQNVPVFPHTWPRHPVLNEMECTTISLTWPWHHFPTPDPDVHPMLDKTAECATISPHLTALSYMCTSTALLVTVASALQFQGFQ